MIVIASPDFKIDQELVRTNCTLGIQKLYPEWNLDKVKQVVGKVIHFLNAFGCEREKDPEISKIELELRIEQRLTDEQFEKLDTFSPVEYFGRQGRSSFQFDELIDAYRKVIKEVPDEKQSTAQKCHAIGCKNIENLQQCGGCEAVFYCSKEHQREDWGLHKPDCKPLGDRNWRQITREFGQIGSDLFS